MSGSFPNRSILIPFMLVLPPAHDSPFLMDQHDAAPKSPSERRMRGKRGKRGKRFMRYNAPAISETGGPKVPRAQTCVIQLHGLMYYKTLPPQPQLKHHRNAFKMRIPRHEYNTQRHTTISCKAPNAVHIHRERSVG
ncbi:predicted protein [Plenodomus lingam JN3]|uniref:Predicted protein n=1 Tax=Leptosphaeria maculans (strain JN3 / isolate v23.1.3 / race Av1-4-5-6-7-8) TaxID=985895 RepID=E4ZJ02_LEPMJ|nr:predicted protein [Plenodomus lingam JN3]CBX91272.1 predicted protein [Plenodomus lingam JN3]